MAEEQGEKLTIKLQKLQETERVKIPRHKHIGTDADRISLKDVDSFIELVTSVPTHIPKNMYEQVKLYVSGSNTSLFIYDRTNKTWRFTNLKS